ncbi:MAG: FKBP-type peptidyl-prolyl cis-trans isomerase [Clostridia bacterium]|nr:FKBP-type peptidyl-prolyl cis-trans isomerase [Clostridia bacterium]
MTSNKIYRTALLFLLIGAMLLLCACGKENKTDTTTTTSQKPTTTNGMDGAYPYPNLNMADYCTFDMNLLQNISITLDKSYYEVTEQDVDAYIHALQKPHLKTGDITITRVTDRPIKRGDIVHLYYTGTMDGKPFSGGCNMTDSKPYKLVIGSDSFISGFEENLIGVIPDQTSLDLRSEGTILADDVVYFTYTVTYIQENGTDKTIETISQACIPLSSLDTSYYGESFASCLVGTTIGENLSFTEIQDFDGDGEPESKVYEGKVLLAGKQTTVAVEATFPGYYEIMPFFSGKTAIFNVAVMYIAEENYPPLTKEFLVDKLKFTPKTDDAVAEFRAMIRETIEEQYEAAKEEHIREEIMEYLVENLVVTRYPDGVVENYYSEMVKGLKEYYQTEKEYCERQYGKTPFTSFSHFVAMVNELDHEDGERYLLERSQALVKESLVIFCVGNNLGYHVTDGEVQSHAAVIAQQLNEYYGSTDITADDVLKEYGKNYITSRVMFEKVMYYCNRYTTVTYE